MKKFILLNAMIGFFFINTNAQVISAAPNTDAVSVNTIANDDKPVKSEKKEKKSRKDRKACADAKGKSCGGHEKKSCCSHDAKTAEPAPAK